MKKKLPVSKFELVAYIILGLLLLWGIIYMILGFACTILPFDNPLCVTDKYLKGINGLGFLTQGIIIVVVSLVVLVIVLLANAKKSDKAFEKTQRRQARISQRNSPEIADAEMSEASSNK